MFLRAKTQFLVLAAQKRGRARDCCPPNTNRQALRCVPPDHNIFIIPSPRPLSFSLVPECLQTINNGSNRINSNQALRRKAVNQKGTGLISPGGTSHHLDDTINFFHGESGHAGGTRTFNTGSTHPRDSSRAGVVSLGVEVF